MSDRGSAVVIGAGVMGSWTARWLQRAGLDVTLVDAHGAGNSLSSSGDESRVTRSAHGLDTHYPVWQQRSLGEWRDLESRSGERLFVRTGVLWLAGDEEGMEADSLATLSGLGTPAERLSTDELAARWPQISTDGLAWAMYEPDAGALMARRATAAVARDFTDAGGRFQRSAVAPPTATAESRLGRVRLSDGSVLEADAFVFAAGPWLATLLPDVVGGERLAVTRQEVVYLAPPAGDAAFDAGNLPIWIEYAAEFYGIPSIEGRGMKFAPDRTGPIVDPERLERRPSDEALAAAHDYARRRFPRLADRPVNESRVCQYESTPDSHFIIDRHPTWEDAWVVGGGSGHGFKHGPAIGQYAAAVVTRDEASARELAPPDDRFRLRDRTPAGAGLRTAAAERG
jgi:glycine/D-amino acid oxidase-like deaminating enzyme